MCCAFVVVAEYVLLRSLPGLRKEGKTMLETLTKWNPLRSVQKHDEHRGTGLKDLNQLQEGINRIFEKFFSDSVC